MNDIGQSLGANGTPYTLPLNGKQINGKKSLLFSHLSKDLQAEWSEKALKAPARAELMAMRPYMDDAAFGAAASKLAQDAAAGVYSFHKPLAKEKLNTAEGSRILAGILLREHQPNLAPFELEEICEEYAEEIGLLLNEMTAVEKKREAERKARKTQTPAT